MKKIALYIHIPFCHKKCFYCSFVISIGHDEYIKRYVDCLIEEMKQYRNYSITSIYFGGGTPSYLPNDELIRLVNEIKKNFDSNNVLEYTFEVNPECVTIEKIETLKRIGVTRLSLGVQTFDDKYLKYLGRNHRSKDAIESFNLIRDQGIKNVSVDLMISFPGQTLVELKNDVNEFLKLDSEHISIYGLTIEKNSRFFSQGITLDDSQIRAHQYEIVRQKVEESCMKQYEVSNYAKEGYESLHNKAYWLGDDYLGLGVGAHSYLNHTRFFNGNNMFDYIKSVENGESTRAGEETLTKDARFREMLVFGLRMNQGVDIKALESKFNVVMAENLVEKIDHLIAGKLLIIKKESLQATNEGRLVLDNICSELI